MINSQLSSSSKSSHSYFLLSNSSSSITSSPSSTSQSNSSSTSTKCLTPLIDMYQNEQYAKSCDTSSARRDMSTFNVYIDDDYYYDGQCNDTYDTTSPTSPCSPMLVLKGNGSWIDIDGNPYDSKFITSSWTFKMNKI